MAFPRTVDEVTPEQLDHPNVFAAAFWGRAIALKPEQEIETK